MTQVIRDQSEAGDAPAVELQIYPSPKPETKGKPVACWSFDHESGPKQVTFHKSNYGMDPETAYEAAKSFAETNDIPFLWINDPDNLFEAPA